MSTKIHIAILAGGMSSEYEVSLRSGKEVVHNLPSEKYSIELVEITKTGKFLLNSQRLTDRSGKEETLVVVDQQAGITKPDLQNYDVVFNALHGQFGEDGHIQAFLDVIGVAYTGSGVLASALGMDKEKTNQLVSGAGVKVPKSLLINKESGTDKVIKTIAKRFGFPCVVKPNQSGSSVGISIVKDEKDLQKALRVGFGEDAILQIQEYISGRELTCGVLGNSGQTELEALPLVEIIPDKEFFDYEAKYHDKATQEICPAEVTGEIVEQVQGVAKQVHELLGCDGLTRSDFILSDSGELYFLEINTSPGMTQASLCPKEALAAGYTFAEFLDRIVELALQRHVK